MRKYSIRGKNTSIQKMVKKRGKKGARQDKQKAQNLTVKTQLYQYHNKCNKEFRRKENKRVRKDK